MNQQQNRNVLAELGCQLKSLDASSSKYATDFVDAVLPAARQLGASDVHFQPTPEGLELSFRLDGVLHPLDIFSSGASTDVVTRLKVQAALLTYQTDTPQEGRFNLQAGVEMRLSTFPTLHGERAVLRIFAKQAELARVDDLGYATDLADWLKRLLQCNSGALLISGPAGSGKTTSLYACLRDLAASSEAGRRSILTMEDPIESALPGVVQSQVNEAAGLTLDVGIRSLVRQDPEVLMIGEIRDPASARAAMNAALTGHLVLSSFHASSPQSALQRLANMDIPPYLVRGGLRGLINQRLARKLCVCKQPELPQRIQQLAAQLDATCESAFQPIGCDVCFQTGYHGRVLIAEHVDVGSASDNEWDELDSSLHANAAQAVTAGATSLQEALRVIG